MKQLGIIDIGSNSIRLNLVKIGKNGSYKIIDDIKETVRLGEGMQKNSFLKKDRIENALKTLKLFKGVCKTNNCNDIIPVATAAVRKANNKDVFINKVKNELDMDVQILSEEEESYYDYLGVINSIDIENALAMDIGGGSIELVLIKDRHFSEHISLPFGTLDLTEKFDLYDSITLEQEGELMDFLFSNLNKIEWLHNLHDIPLIGVGGTMRNIGKIDQKIKKYPFNIIHNYTLSGKDLFEIYDKVKSKNLNKRKKIKGLSKSRADIFIGATAAVAAISEFCNIQDIIISGSGLREGINFSYQKRNGTSNHVLDNSINNIMENYNINKKHARHIHKLTMSLYNQLASVHGLEGYEKEIKTAAFLHDAGINIRYYRHQDHTFYMILYSGILGLSQKELVISAYIAASHRQKKYKLKRFKCKKILNKADKNAIKKIGVLIRIAECLDRSMTGNVKDVKCEINPERITIKTIYDDYPELEIKEATSARKKFNKYFNRDLNIF